MRNSRTPWRPASSPAPRSRTPSDASWPSSFTGALPSEARAEQGSPQQSGSHHSHGGRLRTDGIDVVYLRPGKLRARKAATRNAVRGGNEGRAGEGKGGAGSSPVIAQSTARLCSARQAQMAGACPQVKSGVRVGYRRWRILGRDVFDNRERPVLLTSRAKSEN